MSTGLIGYHPQRVAELQLAAHSAADHLLRVPAVEEPLASAAVSAARLVRLHLEQDWLPALSRVSGSTAMTAFGSFGPTALAGWSGGPVSQVPGPPGGVPPSFGMSNAEAQSAGDAAIAAGTPGVFVGRTKTYEVLETAASTTIPNTGHVPDAGSGRYDVIVSENWYVEHNLTAPPAPYSATPVGPFITWLARLARPADDEPNSVATERGLTYEQLAVEARGAGGPGGVGRDRNVAVGRLTTAEGDEVEIDYRAVSGRADRSGFVPTPPEPSRMFAPARSVASTPRSRSWRTLPAGSSRATTG